MRSPAQTYLVETYAPRLDEASCHESFSRVRTAAAELSRSGTSVRHLYSLFTAEDETCFHVFEAPSIEAVAEATRKAELSHPRIVPVTLDGQTGNRQATSAVLEA